MASTSDTLSNVDHVSNVDHAKIAELSSLYKVGISEIDEQHSILVHYIDEAYSCFISSDIMVCQNLIDKVLTYFKIHFSTEDSYMHPLVNNDQHRAEHSYCLERILLIKEGLSKGRLDIGLELHNVLKIWFMNHILTVDKVQKWTV